MLSICRGFRQRAARQRFTTKIWTFEVCYGILIIYTFDKVDQMERKTDNLIIGAGISGLTFASESSDYLIVERENEIGGYCRTVRRGGFVWDYAGHFFHF